MDTHIPAVASPNTTIKPPIFVTSPVDGAFGLLGFSGSTGLSGFTGLSSLMSRKSTA